MKNILITINIFLLFTGNISSQININDSLYVLSITKIDNKQYSQAIELLNRIIENEPNNFNLYLKKAEVFYFQANYKSAILDFEKACKLEKNCASYQLAECYSQLNNAKKASDYIRIYLKSKNKLFPEEIKLNPAFSNIENSNEWKKIWKEKYYSKYEMKLSEAKYLSSKNDYAEAFEILDIILIKSNNKHRAYSMRGDIFMLVKDYKNAAKDYSHAIKIRKKNIDYLYKRANAYLLAHKYKKALKDYNLLIDKDPRKLILFYKRATVNNELKKYKKALSDINIFLKFYTKNKEALFLCGRINYNNDNFFKALEVLNICVELDKTNPKYFEKRGDIHFNTRTYNYAIKDYYLALDLSPKSGEIYFKIGNTYFKQGYYKRACENWKRAEQLDYYKASDFLVKYCKN